MEKDIRRYEILKRSWKTRPADTNDNHLNDQVVITALINKINQDFRIKRWTQL
jgi:hypothetical protein